MPAASKSIKFTHIPKGAGKGGMFSNSTSHDSDTDTLARVYDFLIDGGKWCPRPAETVFSNILPGHAQAMFIYNFYNEISTVGTSQLLADVDDDGSATHEHAVYRVDDASAAVALVWGPLGQLPNGTKPRVNFASVKNRCFMTSGRGLGYLYTVNAINGNPTVTQVTGSGFTSSMIGMSVYTDYGTYRITGVGGGGTTCTITAIWGGPTGGPFNFYVGWDTPAIYNGTTRYNWGFLPQASNLTYHIAGPTAGTSGITGTATATVGVAPFLVNWVSGDKFDALNPGQNFYMNGYNWYVQQVNSPTQLEIMPGTTPFPVAPAFGGAGPFTFQAGFGSLIGNVTFTGPGGLAWLNGDNYAPLTGGLPFLKIGSTVYVGGQRAIVQALPTPIAAVVIFDGAPGTIPANGVYTFQGNFGALNWDVSSAGSTGTSRFQYCVAYWDPITGHTTNASPIVSPNDGRPNNDGVTVVLSGIITNGDSRFTKILIGRTDGNGNVLRTLAVRPNTGGPLKYVDDQSDGTKLGTVGPGTGAIERAMNNPPPNTGSYIAYWDGRFWMADNAAIGVVYMSKTAQDMINTLGVAEECWPRDVMYQRTIPDSDGKITGLRTVGQNLFIMTDLAVYAVIGSGFSNYRLERISAKGSGTTSLASANLPAEDSQSGDVLVHFGNDNRLYFLYGQGSDLSYSYPIQDQFTFPPGFPTLWWNPETTSVGILHDKRATYIVVSKTNAIEQPTTFLYDLDRKVWLETTIPPYSYYEGLYNGVLTHLVAGSPALGQPNAIYRAMNDPANSTSATVLRTQFVNVPDTNRLDDKILQAVFIYCDDTSVIMDVAAYVDEKYSFLDKFQLVLMPTVDPNYLAYLDAPNARIYQPSNAIVRGRTFRIEILTLASPVLQTAKVPAFACLWSHAEADENIGGNL